MAKFGEGAWITVLIVPLLILLMKAVHHHYRCVGAETKIDQVVIDPLAKPVAVLPVATWTRASQAALQFACMLSDDVRVRHVECPNESGEQKANDWQNQLNAAAEQHGQRAPGVIPVPSPFRFITSPILKYVAEIATNDHEQQVAVIMPELVPSHWDEYLLHNHRSTALKGLLLMQGVRGVVVINVPWYLNE